MGTLIHNFFGYIKIYFPRIIPILIIGIILQCICVFFAKKGYIKYKYNLKLIPIRSMCLSLSFAIVIVMTLYGREPQITYSFRLQLFWSYIEAFKQKNVELLLQIIINIFMFIPIGFFLPCCFEKFEKNRILIRTAILFSGGIECVQGIMKLGMFELDDILGNAIGAQLGFIVYYFLNKTKGFMKRRICCKRE